MRGPQRICFIAASFLLRTADATITAPCANTRVLNIWCEMVMECLANAYIGTSGWNYKSWREHFYGDTPQKRWLRFCAERFTSIEVNGTFYRLQPQSTFEKWRNETPDEFPFAITT